MQKAIHTYTIILGVHVYKIILAYSQLGGVVLPNDGSCKISGTTEPQDYNDWITLDYPSIGQIAQALTDNEIIPIFAAQASALPAYQVTIAHIRIVLIFDILLDLPMYKSCML